MDALYSTSGIERNNKRFCTWNLGESTIGRMSKAREILANNLKRLLKKLDLNELQLSKKSGVSRTTVNNITNQRSSASIDQVQAIAVALGVSAAELLDENPYPYTREAMELAEKFSLADENGKYIIQQIAQREAERAA